MLAAVTSIVAAAEGAAEGVENAANSIGQGQAGNSRRRRSAVLAIKLQGDLIIRSEVGQKVMVCFLSCRETSREGREEGGVRSRQGGH